MSLPIVTVPSCIASSSALWVRGEARLISSARISEPNSGPGWNMSCGALSGRSTSTTVPVMSAGMRSGVNWMRLCEIPSALAKERTMLVLPIPGTPSSSA